MRLAVVVAAVTFALPLAARAEGPPLGYDDARHLLARTGFGPTDPEVRALSALDRHAAVARLIASVRTVAVTPPPTWAYETYERGGEVKLKDSPPAVKEAFRKELGVRTIELREWWYRELLATPSPLTEKMVLFWHNHFVSSEQKVRSNILMYRQNARLRKYALGSFRTLVHEIARDPAMLLYLDGAVSKKEHPNENFAREVMELFTLGEGHYTENDIKEAARAFTGWGVDRDTGELVFHPRQHDSGVKTIFGKTGNFDGDQVIELLLEQPSCAPFVVRKLWRAFVSPTPDEREVARLATLFVNNDWQLAPLLTAMLTSDAFYLPINRATLVKSPIELIVGTLRQLDDTPQQPPTDLRDAVLAGATLGQQLFAPPNVKGWPGGESWIDATTLLARKQLLTRLLRGPEPMPTAMQMTAMAGGAAPPKSNKRPGDLTIDTMAWLATLPGNDNDRARVVLHLLLPSAPYQTIDATEAPQMALREVLLDPVFQLE